MLGLVTAVAASLSVIPPASASALAVPATASISVDRWWQLDPGPLPATMLNGAERSHWLDAAPLAVADFDPSPEQRLRWPSGADLAIREVAAPDGKLKLALGHGASVAYAAAYVTAPRWLKATLHTEGPGPYQVYLDGTSIARVPTATADVVTPVTLPQGLHSLVVKRVHPEDERAASATLTVRLSLEGAFASLKPTFERAVRRPWSIHDVRDLPSVAELALSPDGEQVAEVLSTADPDHRGWTRTLEIRSTRDGHVVETLRLAKWQAEPVWSHDGSHLAFKASGHKGLDLWAYDLARHRLTCVVTDGKGIRNIQWSPDNRLLYYGATESPPSQEEALYQRLEELGDRRPYNHDRERIHVVALDGSVRQQLTFGETNPGDWELSPDGTSIAIIQEDDTAVRPYEQSELVMLDLKTLTQRTDMRLPTGASRMTWSPEGKRLALLAYPAEVAESEPEHNRYQTLYVVDLARHQAKKLLGDTPAITSKPGWSRHDRCLYVLRCDGAITHLVRIGPDGQIDRLPLPADDLTQLSLSEGGERIAVSGSGLGLPDRVLTVSTHGGGLRVLDTPGDDVLKKIQLGAHEPWTFKSARGDTIDGWLLFPPGFDSKRKYPLIVYYYGGALPTARNFNREREWFAAHGYVVYVLNPSGAYGYSQAFADRHVNDWGQVVAEEILTGTKRLLAEKPYLDPARVGNYGGSYGGFMTMDLATKTDLFAASCAMYGISDIASYWGGGYWGYGYGDYALARSYPWNRPDIYVERSPLYHADRIKTPMLLLHGTGDVNVPSLESDQMFTALKILGKDVAYVRFMGQDHGIRGTPAHRQVVDELMLEWFDKYLKGEPEAWDERWRKEKR